MTVDDLNTAPVNADTNMLSRAMCSCLAAEALTSDVISSVAYHILYRIHGRLWAALHFWSLGQYTYYVFHVDITH